MTAHARGGRCVATGPAAFMSYARHDDVAEGGQLSEFRSRLGAEVRMQAGVEFPIFQDRTDIAWGQNWRTRIEETLDGGTLLIPILTPASSAARPAGRRCPASSTGSVGSAQRS